jgi:hypothetical protein
MANELLDFVMSLVRDPEVAARYATDPTGAIADANLTNVTSADVNNLIPMVSDSLSMATPTFDAGGANVWASGAATAAFDAFDVHVPETVQDVGGVIDAGWADGDLPDVAPVVQDPVFVNDIVADPVGVADTLDADDPAGWEHGFGGVAVDDLDPTDGADTPGFDLF